MEVDARELESSDESKAKADSGETTDSSDGGEGQLEAKKKKRVSFRQKKVRSQLLLENELCGSRILVCIQNDLSNCSSIIHTQQAASYGLQTTIMSDFKLPLFVS